MGSLIYYFLKYDPAFGERELRWQVTAKNFSLPAYDGSIFCLKIPRFYARGYRGAAALPAGATLGPPREPRALRWRLLGRYTALSETCMSGHAPARPGG